jgi:N-acetylmuramoyl-L-alanine amidase
MDFRLRRGAAVTIYTRLLVLVGLAVATFAAAAETKLQDVRVWAAPERTRVVFDLSATAEHRLFTLDTPPRVVIDLQDTGRVAALTGSLAGKGVVERVRTGLHRGGDLRVVLDLAKSVPPKSFTLAPNGEYGHRLVVDLEVESGKDDTPAAAERQYRNREFVVAVDAGHGRGSRRNRSLGNPGKRRRTPDRAPAGGTDRRTAGHARGDDP